jgi:hypothetical protein
MKREAKMFRDQTTADLFAVKVPVRQGMCGMTGANPSTADDPCGANRDGSEFSDYLRARKAANRVSELRKRQLRDECDDEPMTMDEAVDLVLAGMGLLGRREEEPSEHAGSRGGAAGSDGVEVGAHPVPPTMRRRSPS